MTGVIRVIMVRGTGEVAGSPHTMLARLRRKLEALAPRRFEWVELTYPASVGPFNPGLDPFGPSLADSLEAGWPELDAEVFAAAHLGVPVIVVGYSLGAYVISVWLEMVAQGLALAPVPRFVGLLANPRRAPSRGLPGQGIAGAHGRWPHRLRYTEIANPRDGITCSNRVLGTIADQVHALSFGNVLATARDWWRRTVTGGWQPSAIDPADPVGTAQAYAEALRLAAGYGDGSEHVRWYIDHGIDQLAAAILAEVGR